MSRYKPTSRARAFLLHLTHYDHATRAQLVGLMTHAENPYRRRRLAKGILDALVADGFVTDDGIAYRITPAGEAALDQLSRGETIDTTPQAYAPTVRIFARPEAAR